MKRIYLITPVPKPRQTQRDRWLNPPRPCVSRYRVFHNLLLFHHVALPEKDSHVTFVLPMPKSWSTKKRNSMDGRYHQQRPDLDNLLKSLMEFYKEDSRICDVKVTKRWGLEGRIIIET